MEKADGGSGSGADIDDRGQSQEMNAI